MFGVHPLLSTYPGASFFPSHNGAGNLNGPHLAIQSGGNSMGYWAHVPWELPQMPQWELPPAIIAAQEGRGTGVWGMTIEGAPPGGPTFNYGWPKYGPMPLKPELGGFVGKINPYGRSWPHGYYKTTY